MPIVYKTKILLNILKKKSRNALAFIQLLSNNVRCPYHEWKESLLFGEGVDGHYLEILFFRFFKRKMTFIFHSKFFRGLFSSPGYQVFINSVTFGEIAASLEKIKNTEEFYQIKWKDECRNSKIANNFLLSILWRGSV